MTLLSDSSDTETDNEEEEMIAELNHLQKSVDLGGIIKNLFSYLPVIGHALAITARGFFHTRTHPTARVLGVRVSRAHTFRTQRGRTLLFTHLNGHVCLFSYFLFTYYPFFPIAEISFPSFITNN